MRPVPFGGLVAQEGGDHVSRTSFSANKKCVIIATSGLIIDNRQKLFPQELRDPVPEIGNGDRFFKNAEPVVMHGLKALFY